MQPRLRPRNSHGNCPTNRGRNTAYGAKKDPTFAAMSSGLAGECSFSASSTAFKTSAKFCSGDDIRVLLGWVDKWWTKAGVFSKRDAITRYFVVSEGRYQP